MHDGSSQCGNTDQWLKLMNELIKYCFGGISVCMCILHTRYQFFIYVRKLVSMLRVICRYKKGIHQIWQKEQWTTVAEVARKFWFKVRFDSYICIHTTLYNKTCLLLSCTFYQYVLGLSTYIYVQTPHH